MNEKACDEEYKKGEKEIKSGFFKSPDYVSGASSFTDAAKGYRKLGLFQKSIQAFSKAFECNGKFNDYWSAGQNAQEMAEMTIFNLNNFDKGLGFLKNASYNFKVGGKFSTSIKTFTDIAQKLKEMQNYQSAEKVLQEAFNDCLEHPEDQLIRISCESVFSLLLDVLCCLEKFPEAIKAVEDMIKTQLQFEENKYKISKNYIKSAILRIIIDESYLVKDIIGKMYQMQYKEGFEDIADTEKLLKSIENVNKKDFNFCIQYAFSLFENNLLKGLQKAFAKKESEKGPMVDDVSQIVVQELILDNNSISQNETKASVNTDANLPLNEEEVKKNNDSEFL